MFSSHVGELMQSLCDWVAVLVEARGDAFLGIVGGPADAGVVFPDWLGHALMSGPGDGGVRSG